MPLNKRNITKLCAALRSGHYTKIIGKLRNKSGYDILGLCNEVYRLTTGKGKWSSPEGDDGARTFSESSDGLENLLGKDVVKFYGFDDGCPVVMYQGREWMLIDLNDFRGGKTFVKIASILESNLD